MKKASLALMCLAVLATTSPSSASRDEAMGANRFTRSIYGSPNFTPRRAAEVASKRWLEAQYAKGRYCRNGGYVCEMGGSGYIGQSCCGCGFCGWWSDR
jgi:hypothetical protein